MVAVSKTTERGVDYSSVRLIALKNGESVSYKYLFASTAKALLNKGMMYPISVNFDKTQQQEEETLKDLGADFVSKAFEFIYEL